MNIPDLESLIRRRMAGDDKDTISELYGVPKNQLGKLIDKILVGIRICQLELDRFALDAGNTGALDASAPPAPLQEAAPAITAEMALMATQPGIDERAEALPVPGDDGLLDRLAARLRMEGGQTGVHEVLRAIMEGKWSRRVVMLMPTYDDINPNIMFAFMAQIRKQPWLGFELEHGTVLQRSRNVLADRFLKSEAEWSLWADSDMALPFRDPGYFYDRLGANPKQIPPQFLDVNAAERLGSSGKTLIGAVYHQRKDNGEARMVIQPHLHPASDGDKELVRSLMVEGPRNQIVPVGYVATGCAMIHRSVYLDIMAAHPERMGKDGIYDFFGHDVGSGGEDIAFCGLAREAGHQAYLDLGLWCGHIGNKCFFPPMLR